ncbi:hypothetical protein ACFQ5M_10765 [Agrilactobacillus yilanensis]|uniref:Type II secretion system protein n=1 Tax=Agrilactobacillus yilanensis TaxID=2485997 RepID=A0ABW4J9M3_9LACO|nr:hypothetical protein [Agrilactobacillus yilanensis]
MLKQTKAYLLVENTISLYILSLGVISLAGILSFGQQQLHRQAQRLYYYKAAEQIILDVTEIKPTKPKKIVKEEDAIQIIWPDGYEINCHVQN